MRKQHDTSKSKKEMMARFEKKDPTIKRRESARGKEKSSPGEKNAMRKKGNKTESPASHGPIETVFSEENRQAWGNPESKDSDEFIIQLSVHGEGDLRVDWATDDFNDVFGELCEKDGDKIKWKYLVHPEDLPKIKSIEQRLVEGLEYEEEMRFLTSGSKTKWVRINFEPLKENEEKKIRCTVKDITEDKLIECIHTKDFSGLEELVVARSGELNLLLEKLKREVREKHNVELTLRAMNKVLESFFSSTHVNIAYMDKNFNFLRVNKAYAEVCGEEPEFFPGKNHFELYPNEENEAIFQRVVETGEPFVTYAKPFVFPDDPDEKVTYWDWTLSPIKDSSGVVQWLLFYLVDVTEKEVMRRELDKQRALAVRSDRLRALGEMAAGIAHEVNQPLMGIRNMAEHLLISIKKGHPVSPEAVLEKALAITEQADRMSHVIEHSQIFARSSTDSTWKQPVCINEVVFDAVSFIGAQMRSRGIELRLDLESDLPRITINPFSLEEVVMNLLGNARDAVLEKRERGVDGHEPKVVVKTGTIEGARKDFVCLQVKDNGIGMGDKTRKRIFEPFFSTKDPGEGTGLGLSICKQILKSINGELDLDSTPEEGTTASIVIPYREKDNS